MDKYTVVICSYKVFQETLEMGQATVAINIQKTILYVFTKWYK